MKASETMKKILALFRELEVSRTRLGASQPWLSFINIPDVGLIQLSPEIDDELAQLSRTLLNSKPQYRTIFKQSEFLTLVRSGFGAALGAANTEDDITNSADCIVSAIKAYIEDNKPHDNTIEYSFPCHLFSGVNIPPLILGPVRFETREKWIERKRDSGQIEIRASKSVLSAITASQPSDAIDNILPLFLSCLPDAIRHHKYVCSVETKGLGKLAGRERALLAARLATTMIALLWNSPSHALSGLRLLHDGLPITRHVMVSPLGRRTACGWSLSHAPDGPAIPISTWQETLRNQRDYFDSIGNVLSFVIAPDDRKLLDRLVQALH